MVKLNLDSLKGLFNLNADGTFRHGVKETSGEIRLVDGRLVNTGHFFFAPKGDGNESSRRALLQALGQTGIGEDVLAQIKSGLGLADDANRARRNNPLSSKTVKNLLVKLETMARDRCFRQVQNVLFDKAGAFETLVAKHGFDIREKDRTDLQNRIMDALLSGVNGKTDGRGTRLAIRRILTEFFSNSVLRWKDHLGLVPEIADRLVDGIIDDGGAEPVPPQDPVRTEEAVAEEEFVQDILSRAAEKVTRTVSSEDIRGTEGVVDSLEMREAEEVRRKAEESLANLDQLTGQELAHVFSKDPEHEKARTVFNDAVKSQRELGNALSALAAKTEGPGRAWLERLALRAKLCATEIGRLAGDLARLESDSPKAWLLNEKRLTRMLPEITKRDRDAGNVVRRFKEQLRPIAARIAALSHGEAQVPPEQIEQLGRDLEALGQALAAAARDGIDDGEGGRIKVDADLFDALNQVLRDMSVKVADAGAEARRQAIDVLAKQFCFPGAEYIDSGRMTFAEMVGGDENVREYCPDVLPKFERLGKLVRSYGETGSAATLTEIRKIVESEEFRLAMTTFRTLNSVSMYELLKKKNPSPEEKRQICIRQDIQERILGKESYRLLVNQLENVCRRPVENARRDLLAVLKGGGAATYAQVRAMGVDPFDLDMQILGRKPVSVTKLGQGATSSVYACRFRLDDGTEVTRVFKPESTAFYMLPEQAWGRLMSGTGDNSVLGLNLLARQVAEMFGCGGNIANAHVGMLDGKIGMFLDLIPGAAPGGMTGDAVENVPENEIFFGDRETSASVDDVRRAPAQTRAALRIKVAQQLNDLHWLDVITGQLDRHNNNYMIHVSKDMKTVSVTGIDNDMCFPEDMVGIMRYRITYTHARDCLHMLGRPGQGGKGIDNADLERLRAFVDSYPKDSVEGEKRVIDLSAFSKDTVARMQQSSEPFKFFRTFRPPQYMNAGMYEKIRTLVQEDCREFRAALAMRKLTSAQIESAVARLKDAWKHAEKLRKNGLVFTEADWGKADTIGKFRQMERAAKENTGTDAVLDYALRGANRGLFGSWDEQEN